MIVLLLRLLIIRCRSGRRYRPIGRSRGRRLFGHRINVKAAFAAEPVSRCQWRPASGTKFQFTHLFHFLLYWCSAFGTKFFTGFQFRPALPAKFYRRCFRFGSFRRCCAADHFLQGLEPFHQCLHKLRQSACLVPKPRVTSCPDLKGEEVIGKSGGR